jgi:hypothetical protein
MLCTINLYYLQNKLSKAPHQCVEIVSAHEQIKKWMSRIVLLQCILYSVLVVVLCLQLVPTLCMTHNNALPMVLIIRGCGH